jgi:ComEC/Rec2-related protein
MVNYLIRYALAVCVLSYMAGIVIFHLLGLFPRSGIYDVSRLIGSSQVTVEGRVLDTPIIRWNQTRFLIQGRAFPLRAFEGKTLVTLAFPDEDLAPGDIIGVRGWLSAPRPPSAARDFDEQGYWASKRVFSMLKVWSPAGLTVLHRKPSWNLERVAWAFHKRYREFWENVLPEDEAGLLLGITMGARGILPAAIKEACIRAGVYHIVVVSGQNMSLIVGLGVSLLAMLQVPRRHAFWICWVPIVFYTAAVGGDPPVVRAAAMALVGLLSAALGRDIPRYYPLLLAAGWILLWEPEAILGASFQLSFGATLSILAILPSWNELPHPTPLPVGEDKAKPRVRGIWRRWLKQAGLMGLTVHMGIWPLLVYYFHRLSFAGFVANWTVFPMSGILMIFGLLVGTWGVLSPGTVPVFLVHGMYFAVHWTLALIESMAAGRWAVRQITPPAWWVCGLYYGFLFGILFTIHRRKNGSTRLRLAHHESNHRERTK